MCVAYWGPDHSSIGPKTFTELLIPISFTCGDKLFEELDDLLIECFC